jgi:hypothetical protein
MLVDFAVRDKNNEPFFPAADHKVRVIKRQPAAQRTQNLGFCRLEYAEFWGVGQMDVNTVEKATQVPQNHK